jgi:oleandomycin transport system permease protein
VQLIEVTIQPIIFLLLFLYVFGGAFAGGSRHDYLQYLLPGCSAGASPWAASRSGRT